LYNCKRKIGVAINTLWFLEVMVFRALSTFGDQRDGIRRPKGGKALWL
jgi:hypothetical protein